MKFIIITLLATLFSLTQLNAQVTQPPYIDTCQYLSPLQGEWMNVSGSDTIRIFLRHHRWVDFDPETYNSTVNQLWGWVEYKQGNNIIMSDYANRFSILPYNIENVTPGLRSINLWTGRDGCTNPQIKLEGAFRDIIRCRQKKNIMATVNSSSTQMTWKLVQPTALLDSMWCGGMTLPQEFTLTKQ
jgi:hypothetical protein